MSAGIYEIMNTASGVRYIGSAQCIKTRLQQHKGMLKKGKHHSIALQRAWDKYGADAFAMRPVAILEDRELLSTEQRFLDAEHKGETYNIAKDAVAWFKGRKHTDEWNEKAAKWRKGNKSKTGIPSPWKGLTLSEEHKAKLKSAKAVVTAETRQKMRDAKLNDEDAMERLKRITQANIGRTQPESQIAKRVEKLRGRKMPTGALAKSWETRRANALLKESEEP